MKREDEAPTGPVMVPGVVSLAASSRRTLKHGDSFAMFDEFGDVVELEHSPTGLFHFDTRFLSRLFFTLEGHRPLILSSTVQPDNLTLDVDLTNPDLFQGERLVLAKDTFHVARAKFLWEASCHELFTITNYADRRMRVRFALEFAADFADLFEIRGYLRTRRGAVASEQRGPAEVAFAYRSLDGIPRETRVRFDAAPAALSTRRAEFDLEIDARARRCVGLQVQCLRGSEAARAEGFYTTMRRARRSLARTRAGHAKIDTSNVTVNGILSRSSADLEMLQTETPFGPYPYAGVPWFSTVFGRDGILTAMEVLWFDTGTARGVLRFLAAHHGGHRAAPAAAVAADLEQVGEIGGELEREAHAPALLGVARHGEQLVAAGLPQELRARHVEGVLRQDQAVAAEDVRAGQVHVQRQVVGLHRGGKAQRAVALQGEVQAREVARVEVEQPRRAVLDLHHVAELVEHGEAVGVLQRAPAGSRQRHHARDQDRAARGLELRLVLHTAFSA